jgi:ipoprotein LpqH
MTNRFALITAAVAVGCIAGCSSVPSAVPLQPGTLAPGTAKVTINDVEAGTTNAVHCTAAGDLTTITTGDSGSGVTALVSSVDGLSAVAVNINAVGGFTGSYNEGLSAEPAKVDMTGRTYDITGTADGFNAENPSARSPGSFALKVAC